MPNLESSGSYVTFRSLGGSNVTLDQAVSEIAHWPLDGIMGFLGVLSLQAVQAGPDFSDPRWQGYYLNLAIVDDFPCTLPRALAMYAPGRVPSTGEDHILVHERNVAWLAHVALLFARDNSITPALSYELQRRLCRLLLIANDFFNHGENVHIPASLGERQAFTLGWLRESQFNQFFDGMLGTMVTLARQKVLLLDILPEYFPSAESAFCEATGGVTIEKYFEILTVFIAHLFYEMAPDRQWLERDRLCARVGDGREQIERMLTRWIRTPADYRRAWEEWTRCRPTTGFVPFYDFVPLRETPFIEARSGELICPVVPFLLAKIVDEPYFILADYFSGSHRFQDALGKAYEKYAQQLVSRIARADRAYGWHVHHQVRTKQGAELADSYLQRDKIAITFEHKGQRPGTDFLRGGQGDRVLGPDQIVLAKLESHRHIPLQEGRNHDNGLFTRGMWQQSIAGPSLPRWAKSEVDQQPSQVFPIITHLVELRIDKVSQMAYLSPLIEQAQLYQDAFWELPQWLHINDLEGLTSLAERGQLDLEALLREKITQFAQERFDIFLYNRFGFIPCDRQLVDVGRALLENAKRWFPS